MCRKKPEKGTASYILRQYLWMSDECEDSEKLIGILEQIGYVKKETEDADFVIYNTCTVRENANNKVYGRLGYLHSQKKRIRI